MMTKANVSIFSKLAQEENSARKRVLEAIQTKTKRKVITYISRFDHPGGMMVHDDAVPINELLKSLNFKDGDMRDVDLVIHSPGGVVTASERIVSLIRNSVDSLRVLVPVSAKSAATLLCLAADEIVVTDVTELGPTDPQMPVGSDPNTGQAVYRPAWSYLNSLDILEEKLKAGMPQTLIIPLVAKIEPALLDMARNALDYSSSLSERWLVEFMKLDPSTAKKAAKHLSGTAHKFHSRAIGYQELNGLGLKVTVADKDLQDLLLELQLRSYKMLQGGSMKLMESVNTSMVGS